MNFRKNGTTYDMYMVLFICLSAFLEVNDVVVVVVGVFGIILFLCWKQNNVMSSEHIKIRQTSRNKLYFINVLRRPSICSFARKTTTSSAAARYSTHQYSTIDASKPIRSSKSRPTIWALRVREKRREKKNWFVCVSSLNCETMITIMSRRALYIWIDTVVQYDDIKYIKQTTTLMTDGNRRFHLK